MNFSLRWVLSIILVYVLSGLCYFFNVTPWVFFSLIGFVVWESLRFRWGIATAFTATILGLLFLLSIWQYLSPLTGLTLEVSNFLSFSVVGLACVIHVVRRNPPNRPPKIRGHALFVPVTVMTVITAILLAWFQLSVNPHVSFAMNGDAVWNTVTARFVIAGGGIVPVSHPNPAPLTAELLASVDAPGRNFVSSQDLLLHDVVRQAQLWFVLLWAASVVIMGLVASALRGATTKQTQFISTCAGLLPFTWFFSGFAFFFGFYNASIAVLVLLVSWHIWLQAQARPVFSLLLLAMGSVVLLATWAPLVVITGALSIALVLRQGWRFWLLAGPLRIVTLLSTGLIPISYFALFSLADLRREGAALSVDGGIFELSPYLLVGLPLLISVATLTRWQQKLSQQSFWGVLAIVLGAGTALGYLVWQRKDVSQLWGYYPVKFSWLVATLLIVVLLTVLVQWVDFSRLSSIQASTSLLAIGTLVGALMLMAKPLGITEIFSPTAVIFSKGVGVNDTVVAEISGLAAENNLVVAVGYEKSPQQDLFMNNWLLQLPVDRPDSQQRWFSYFLDGADLALVCKAGDELNQPITVITRESNIETQLGQLCNNKNIKVRVIE